MRGGSTSGGHAWLCNGYYFRNYAHEVILKTMQTKSSFYTVNYGEQGPGGIYTYFHMVWGLLNSGNNPNDGDFLESEVYFSNSRQDIINIYPTNN